MKRFTLAILLLLGLGAHSHAQQVPNGDFETWTTRAGADRPQSWLSLDDVLEAEYGIPIATGTVAKTTDKQSGSFAARLQTVGPVPGYLILGTTVADRNDDIPGGMPFTGRPAAMQLQYKTVGSNIAADKPIAGAILTRTTNGKREVIAQGGLVLTAAATYTLATVPLQYQSTLTPDSLHIVIISGTGENLTSGTALYVDNLVMRTTLATRDTEAARSLTLFPNPSADGLFTLGAAHEPALLNAPLTVSDLTGRVVLSQAAPTARLDRRAVDLRGQPTGVYLLRLAAEQGPITRRLVIR